MSTFFFYGCYITPAFTPPSTAEIQNTKHQVRNTCNRRMALKFYLHVFENVTGLYESSQVSPVSLSTHALSN